MAAKYTLIMRVLHWLMAVLVLGMIALGWYMDGLPREDVTRVFFYSLHKSVGVTILLLVVARVVVRWRSPLPALPAEFKPLEKQLAHATHYLLYALMLLLPLLGYAMINGYGFTLQWFGVALPNIFPANRDMAEIAKELHGVLAYGLLGLIALHVAAVVKHAVIDKTNLLKRMF